MQITRNRPGTSAGPAEHVDGAVRPDEAAAPPPPAGLRERLGEGRQW
ncbi:hypothetical protein ACFVT1_36830 [Streptomyces sp. NPDC057963]